MSALLDEVYAETVELLRSHIALLRVIADAVLTNGEIDGEELAVLVGDLPYAGQPSTQMPNVGPAATDHVR